MPQRRLLFTLSVNGGEPVPCDFQAETVHGLKSMRFEAHTALFPLLGERVHIVLAGDGQTADGEGLVTEVSYYGDEPRTTILADGPLRMLPKENP